MILGAHVAALLLCLFVSCLAATPPAPHLQDKTVSAPRRFDGAFVLKGQTADARQPYSVTLHLAGQDEAGLEAWLLANAGENVLTPEELARYITPPQASIDAVKTLLMQQGGIDESAITTNTYKNKITAATTVETAATLFNATFHDYQVAGTSTVVQRTKQYVIPGAVAGAVSYVSPLASFFKAKANQASPIKPVAATQQVEKMQKRSNRQLEHRSIPSSAECNVSAVTPNCLRQYYGTYDFRPVPHPVQNDIVVFTFNNFTFAPSDLKLCLSTYRPEAADAQVQVIDVAGSSNSESATDDNVESMLDVCTVVAATWPLKTVFYSYGTPETQGDGFQLAFQDILDNYVAYGRPGVLSLSFGDLESHVTREEAQVMCKTASHLAALGMTIVTGAGDWGVGGLGQYNSPGDPTCPDFQALYPPNCPYVLAVGATQDFAPEVVINATKWGYTSGSGFSNYFPRPSYQDAAVKGWMKSPSAKPAKAYYNASGRAYPDVAAQGTMYTIALHGKLRGADGTSASCPTVASIYALLNSARRLIGKPNIGWANPALYLNSVRATKDITSGFVGNCVNAPKLGFNATTSWNPASGWGTPLFDRMRVVYGVPA